MKKSLKKVSALAICLSMICNTMPVMAAEETGGGTESAWSWDAQEVQEAADYIIEMENGDWEEEQAEVYSEDTDSSETDEQDAIASGTCGADVQWELTNDGTLTIFGSGQMNSFDSGTPWYDYRTQIQKVVIEDGVTSIGGYAFAQCTNLVDIEIPYSVNDIREFSFIYCESLESIYIPPSVSTMGIGMFAMCKSLKSIEVDERSTSFCSVNGALYSIDMISLGAWPIGRSENVVVPDGVKIIIPLAFAGCEMSEVSLPEGLEYIAMQSFLYCGNLETICIPASVTTIESAVFAECHSLKEIDIAEGNPIFSSEKGALFGKTDDGAKVLVEWPAGNSETVDIPENVDQIAAYALCCCHMTDVVIPVSVKKIGESAFYLCPNLTEVRFKGNMPQIDNYAFSAAAVTCYYPENDETWTAEKLQNYNGSLTWEAYSEEEGSDSGICGENVTWTLNEDGVLTISGEGLMSDYDFEEAPWYPKKNQIVSVTIENGVTSIGAHAFEDCINLNSIKMPSKVKRIGAAAFNNCTALTNVDIPKSVTDIAEKAFANCSNLVSVEIPYNVVFIGNCVFEGCSSLTDITFKGHAPSFDNECFSGVSVTVHYPEKDQSWTEEVQKDYGGALTWEAYEGEYVLASGTCGEDLTWVLDSNELLTISGDGEMYSYNTSSDVPWSSKRNNISSVVVEDGAASISDYAFYGCSHLTSANLAGSVASIGEHAFENCTKLTDVQIQEGLESIGNNAFYNCTNLKKISIPGSVANIGSGVFIRCSSLKAIYVEEENQNYSYREGILFDHAMTTLICYPQAKEGESYTIPESTAAIGECAFGESRSLKEITIPASVTEIKLHAFEACSNLTDITFEGSAPTFEAEIFNDTSVTVHYPANDASWTEEVRQNYGGTLTWEPYGKENVVDSGTCGENLTWSLNSNGLLSIKGTGKMDNYDPWNNNAPWKSQSANIISVVIEKNVTSIGDYAFYDCTSLVDVDIADSVITVGDSAFQECSSLKNVDIPNSVISIDQYAFLYCGNLESITLSNSIRSMGDYIFSQCSNLKSVNIPESVESIGNGAFANCKSLREINVEEGNKYYSSMDGVLFNHEMTQLIHCPAVGIEEYTIPEGVEEICGYAFYGCVNLQSISIPNSVTRIDESVFCDCTSLKKINIPDSLNYMGFSAFENCSSLTCIDIPDKMEDIEERAFYGCSSLTSMELPESLISIKRYLFGNCSNLKNIKLPESVTSIAEGAFYYCNSLASIKIPKGVTRIENYTFYECTDLNIEIPDSITHIGSSAFGRCRFTSIEIPASVEYVGADAFSLCQHLTDITFNGQAPDIGENAFYGVTTTVYYPENDSSWTEEIRQNYGGHITWVAKESEPEGTELKILVQPENVTGEIGDTATFAVEAEGDGITYQWQYCNSGSTTWKNSSMTGTTTNKIEVKITKGRIGQKYRCVLTDARGNTVTTKEAQIIQAEKELAILQQPENAVGNIGDKAVFSIKAEGDGVTYQWQYCNSGSSTWANSKMTGATTNKIEVAITKGRIGQKYRCVVKDIRGNALTTEEAQIIQAEKELVILQQPENVIGKIGSTATFEVKAEGDGITYQWQYCNNGSSTWKNSSMTGSTTNKIEVTITKGRIGQKYRCVLKDNRGNMVTTEAAQIIQAEKELVIIQQPENVSGNIGDTAAFEVKAEGDGITYQWQYCNSGSSTWKNSSMTGSTTNKIEVTITKGRIGQKYRCILKDGEGNKVTTKEAQIILAGKDLAILQQPESVVGNIGDTATFVVKAEGEGVIYQWQYCNNGSTSWVNSKMTGATTNTISVKITKGRIGQKYRCILKDSKGNKLTTEEAQIIQ